MGEVDRLQRVRVLAETQVARHVPAAGDDGADGQAGQPLRWVGTKAPVHEDEQQQRHGDGGHHREQGGLRRQAAG